jgi:segregation and condensation protein A
MNIPASQGMTLSNYQLRLPDFEGPLDVLLRLIERSQLAITDVSLVSVTQQFLAVLADMRESTSLETVAEFAAVGTRLTLLKSRSLLPRPPQAEEDERTDSDLTVELNEYKRMKDVARQLGERHTSGLSLFTSEFRSQVPIPAVPKEPALVSYEANVLLRSIRRRLTVVPKPIQQLRQRRIVSIRDMIDRVLHLTSRVTPVSFSHLSASYNSRTDVATAFLAVLVLVRRHSLRANQPHLFGDIDLLQISAEPLSNHDIDEDDFL